MIIDEFHVTRGEAVGKEVAMAVVLVFNLHNWVNPLFYVAAFVAFIVIKTHVSKRRKNADC